MAASNDTETPIVEPNPSGDSPDTGIRALQDRIRQQELLAALSPTWVTRWRDRLLHTVPGAADLLPAVLP